MNEPLAADPDRLRARVMELESLLTYLQRTVTDLDQVVLQQQQRIEALERKALRLNSELSALAGSVTEERKPEDEKPPHY